MVCCIAVAFLLGLVRQGWQTLRFAGDTGPVTPLPPPARRPQPGTAPTAPLFEPARAPRRWESDVLTPARAALELRFAGAGIAVYAGMVGLLGILGAADGSAGATGWILRDALFAVLAVMALVVARSCAGSEPSPRGRERLACALLGGGAMWLELGLLDMHFFGLFAIAHGALGWDALFHGSGAVAFIAGWALLVSDSGVRRRTWRHEPSTAS